MKLAVIGATGQLGSEIVKAAEKRGHTVEGFRDGRWWVTKNAKWYGDVTDVKAMQEILECIRPDVVVNTAAFHDVEGCEKNPQRAFEVNALGAENIQQICDALDCLHIFISTDQVFGGKPPDRPEGYSVDEQPHPLNVYGWSKWAGENAVLFGGLGGLHGGGAVVRVSYLFGKGGSRRRGGNFVDKVLEQLDAAACHPESGEGSAVRANADSSGKERPQNDKAPSISRPGNVIVSPTYAVDAAEAILNITEPGIYHCPNIGWTSLYGLARAIALRAGFDVRVEPNTYTWPPVESRVVWASSDAIRIRDFPVDHPPARRPEFSALIPSEELGITRTWAEGLEDYLKEIGRAVGPPLGDTATAELAIV